MTAVGRSPSGFESSSRSASRPPPTVNVECATRPSWSRAARSASRRPERLLARRQGVLVAGDEADALVPELDQVLRRDAAGRALVDADRRDVEVLRAAVHEHEPRAPLEELRVVRVLPPDVRDLGGDEDHPLDAALEQHAHVVALAAGGAVRVAEDGCEAASRGVHLHRLGERGEDRVRELRHEEPDRARLPRSVPAGRTGGRASRPPRARCVSGRTADEPLATRDAVARLTPARSATSLRLAIGLDGGRARGGQRAFRRKETLCHGRPGRS